MQNKSILLFLSFFLLLSFAFFREEARASELSLFYWDSQQQHGFINFGDHLSTVLVERIIGKKIPTTHETSRQNKTLLGIGSILNYAQDHDVIWGTGINGKTPLNAYQFTSLDVRAVRGPITRKFLIERGIACPEVYGDPTLLFPLYFPEYHKKENPLRDYVIIPHFSDEHLFLNDPHLVSVKENWKEVILKVLESKFVIASALSGIIIAEAYGIPARLIILNNDKNTENLVKYQDYYEGTHRFSFSYATTIEEALQMGGEPPHRCDLEQLIHSFPSECFN